MAKQMIQMGQLDIQAKPKTEQNAKNPLSEIEQFGREVMKALVAENIPPLPAYYALYFEKLLEEKPRSFKKMVSELISEDDESEIERAFDLQRKLKNAFVNTRDIINEVAGVYRQMGAFTENNQKRISEAKAINNPQAIVNFTTVLSHDMSKINDFLKNRQEHIKTLYQKNTAILRQVEEESIYDAFYGVYNKKYLSEQLQKEINDISTFGHNSCLISIKLRKSLLNQISAEKGQVLVVKTLAKLLLKTSRRSDIVSHAGNGIFAILFRHTDVQSAMRGCERIADLVANANFFLGDEEVELSIASGILSLSSQMNPQEAIESAVIAMNQCDSDNNAIYTIFSAEES